MERKASECAQKFNPMRYSRKKTVSLDETWGVRLKYKASEGIGGMGLTGLLATHKIRC